MSETAVERRLRDVCRWAAEEGGVDAGADSAAIDAGREALELLRRMPVSAVRGPVGADWLKFRAALLARCEGETR